MSNKPIYEGYKPQDFWRDFELAHQGADLMGDALVDSPTGLIGIGGFGDYVDKIIQPGALKIELVNLERTCTPHARRSNITTSSTAQARYAAQLRKQGYPFGYA